MTSESITFRLATSSQNENSALEKYLFKDALRAKELIPGNAANLDIQKFQQSLNNLSMRLDEFQNQDKHQQSFLVLGKIQSGKTSHLLGTIAWTIDSKFSFAAMLTGISGELNTQTLNRLEDSLNSLGSNLISVFEVPTKTNSREYQDLKYQIFALIDSRVKSTERKPLPVLVTMKNKYRLATMNHLFREIYEEFGPETKVLIIDDEADQASQNSKASTSKTTVTYDAMVDLRESGLANVLLSYTATPQAVLLTDKKGKLRPDECVVSLPRYGYLGLESISDSSYSNQLIEVDDWPDKGQKISTCPQSLKECVIDFFLVVLIRNEFPAIFFEESGLPDISTFLRDQSLQMMIHEAVEVAKHSEVYKLVRNEKSDLLTNLRSYIQGDMQESVRDNFVALLDDAWLRLMDRLPVAMSEKLDFGSHRHAALCEILEETEILVVNADKKRPNFESNFPTSSYEWNCKKAWILIGGDILGRGLTIPQLVTTYFLRSSKIPNFDTVSQQMRFCGYRKAYRSFTSIWATNQTFLTLQYMNKVESIMWNRVTGWDLERKKISIDFPRVIYASPLDVRMEPTRKSVRDPNLVDKKITGNTIFSAKCVMDPNLVADNLNLIGRWVKNKSHYNSLGLDWIHFDESSNNSIQSLLREWNVAPAESLDLNSAIDLFEDDLDDLGLAFVPKSFFVSSSVLGADMGSYKEIDKTVEQAKFRRTLSHVPESATLENWKQGFIEELPKRNSFSELSITHVGDTQRNLRKHLAYDSAIFVIEFVRGTTNNSGLHGTVALGLCMSILSPSGYEIRTLGHR